MALTPEDMATLKLAFGDHDEPERRMTSMVGSVIKSAAACTDAMAALDVDLVSRWNASAELLDRVEIGVDGLRRSADRHTALLALVRGQAMAVMEVLGRSAEEASEGLEERRPQMVQKMEALVTVLASRTATLHEKADAALNEWTGFLAGQEGEVRQLVAFSQQASAGMDKAIADAHNAVNQGVASLNQRFAAMGGTSSQQLDVIEDKVIAPAFNRWAGAVDDLPEAVEEAVTALVADFTAPATEAGTKLAQGAADVKALALALSTRMAPVLRDLAQRRGRIDASEPNLARQRDSLPITVALCRETAEAIGEPW